MLKAITGLVISFALYKNYGCHVTQPLLLEELREINVDIYAGQFNVFLHGLCWVHAKRLIHKLVGYTKVHRIILDKTRSDIWQLYRDLKAYRLSPDYTQKIELEKRFDGLFIQKTGFVTLDLSLKRIYNNKEELLLVLERPDIPLHNNLSENDIREYVKKRKNSGSTTVYFMLKKNNPLTKRNFYRLKHDCQMYH